MKKTDKAIIEKICEHARLHPDESYPQIAIAFGVSLASVKRFCTDLGRSKSWRRGRISDVVDEGKFWAQVDKQEGECWQWNACKNPDGYGFFSTGGRSVAVHRIAYELTKGRIPDGLDVDHLCKNRGCCNPDHLEAVSHRVNMERAGIIPTTSRAAIDTTAVNIDADDSIETVDSDPNSINGSVVSPLLNEESVSSSDIDTPAPLTPVSMPKQGEGESMVKCALTTPRPPRPDPFAPLCTMETPPALEPIKRPERNEAQSGTKADLDIHDWAETEFGKFWCGQTDEELRDRSIAVQTEAMREDGEFLHWYRVDPIGPEAHRMLMSARTGPEACVKLERSLGKGWAHSWEYIAPDPHRGPFFNYKVLLVNGYPTILIARTQKDAISMIEDVWGPGNVLYAERLSRPIDSHLRCWQEHWREYLKAGREKIEERQREGKRP
jgi:hypothetical protein